MKKKNKAFKKQLRSFFKSHRTLIAALGGAAAGIAIAAALGTEKAQQMLHSVEGNIKDFSTRMSDGIRKHPVSKLIEPS